MHHFHTWFDGEKQRLCVCVCACVLFNHLVLASITMKTKLGDIVMWVRRRYFENSIHFWNAYGNRVQFNIQMTTFSPEIEREKPFCLLLLHHRQLKENTYNAFSEAVISMALQICCAYVFMSLCVREHYRTNDEFKNAAQMWIHTRIRAKNKSDKCKAVVSPA